MQSFFLVFFTECFHAHHYPRPRNWSVKCVCNRQPKPKYGGKTQSSADPTHKETIDVVKFLYEQLSPQLNNTVSELS